MNYKEKYLKYKNKYINLKQIGGNKDLHDKLYEKFYTTSHFDSIESEKEKHIKIEEYVKKLMTEILNSFKHTFESEKEFNIYIKILKYDPTDKDTPNKLKICHHYSIFSLIDNIKGECCAFNSELFKDTFKPKCEKIISYGIEFENCDYSTLNKDIIYKVPEIIQNNRNKYVIRLLNKERIDNTFYSHSARFEKYDGKILLFHKFSEFPILIAIDTNDDNIRNFNYITNKEITIESYDVPSNIFLNNDNSAIYTKINI